MKKDFLKLIDDIDYIKSKFYVDEYSELRIYTNDEFIKWKQGLICELTQICKYKTDKFITDTLNILNHHFNGVYDEKLAFNELYGALIAIKTNIEIYYPNANEKLPIILDELKIIKTPKIFISHSNQDKNYVIDIVDLLEDIGITQEHLICSSISEYGIPLGEDIYNYLKKSFQSHNLHVIFVLSDNYYNSPACLNEMGAAWVLQNKYTIILLPKFEFKEIKGAINPRQIGLKLDENTTDVKERLGELKNNLIQEFELSQMSEFRWERKRDDFISKIKERALNNKNIQNSM